MPKLIVLIFLNINLAIASGGSFDKKKEDSYQLIVIGRVYEIRIVPLIGNLPATEDDIKKEHLELEQENPIKPKLSKRTLLYTGILTVEKPIKGKSKKGDKILVTWWQAGGADKKGNMRPLLMCPRVTNHVASGDRRVIAVTSTSGHTIAGQSSFIVDGPVSNYEPPQESPHDPDDPFAPEAPKAKEVPNKEKRIKR